MIEFHTREIGWAPSATTVSSTKTFRFPGGESHIVTSDTYNHADEIAYLSGASGDDLVGVGRDLYKDPVTDRERGGSGTKKSAKGLLAVQRKPNADGRDEYVLIEQAPEGTENDLVPVWENGKFLKTYSFAEIRERIRNSSLTL